MHAAWYPTYATQTGRQEEFLRWAEAERRADGLDKAATPARAPVQLLEGSLARFVRDAFSLVLRSPGFLRTLLDFARRQRRAARERAAWEVKGVHVPPLMIASITETC